LKELYEIILRYASSDTIKKKPKNNSNNKQNEKDEIRESIDSNVGLSDSHFEEEHFENEHSNSAIGEVNSSERVLTTDRSLVEDDHLADRVDSEETLDDTRKLSLSYTIDENDMSKLDDEQEANK